MKAHTIMFIAFVILMVAIFILCESNIVRARENTLLKQVINGNLEIYSIATACQRT